MICSSTNKHTNIWTKETSSESKGVIGFVVKYHSYKDAHRLPNENPLKINRNYAGSRERILKT